jgi:RsiW-degrading membrane proteinase PrsW (M82 family)
VAGSLDNLTLIAIAGGLLPSFFWLWFWLHEDRLHPEPKRLIVSCFISGVLMTVLALPAERYTENLFVSGFILYLAWAFIEEFVKFIGAFFAGLTDEGNDEPIDAMVYMISVALGFAALENTLFLVKAFEAGGINATLSTGNIRFLGATLVHIVSSAIIGGSLALAYYKSWRNKLLYFLVGLITASVLHASFNFIIINDKSGKNICLILLFLWLSVIAIFLLFEKVKHLNKE